MLYCNVNLVMPYCNWNPLHALLQLLTLVFTLYITLWFTNFSMHCHNGQLLHDLLQLIPIICTLGKHCFVCTIPDFTFFVCTIGYYKFWLHCCKWQIVWNSGIFNFFHCYDNCWFIMTPLQLATCVSTIWHLF